MSGQPGEPGWGGGGAAGVWTVKRGKGEIEVVLEGEMTAEVGARRRGGEGGLLFFVFSFSLFQTLINK